MGTTRNRLVPCDQATRACNNLLGALIVGKCLHHNHTWHKEAWWHDPDRMRGSLLHVNACPQRNLHSLLSNEPCGLCTFNAHLRFTQSVGTALRGIKVGVPL